MRLVHSTSTLHLPRYGHSSSEEAGGRYNNEQRHHRGLPQYKCLTKDRLCLEELNVHRRQNRKERGISSNAVPCPGSHNRLVEEPRWKLTDNSSDSALPRKGSRPCINEEAKHYILTSHSAGAAATPHNTNKGLKSPLMNTDLLTLCCYSRTRYLFLLSLNLFPSQTEGFAWAVLVILKSGKCMS